MVYRWLIFKRVSEAVSAPASSGRIMVELPIMPYFYMRGEGAGVGGGGGGGRGEGKGVRVKGEG